MAFFKDKSVPPATKIFDNLYYVGVSTVGAYALQTSDGIILIDALNNTEEAKNVIEPGMRELGLDPNDIKIIIVTHGHGDHYGGAKYLSDKYQIPVMMSEPDWTLAANPQAAQKSGMPAPDWSDAPEKDLVANDGQEVTYGDTSVKLIATPGHTPGTMSLIFPVFENGKRHLASMWGGTGIPSQQGSIENYIRSAKKFASIEKELGVDVTLSNHPFVDDSVKRMRDLRDKPESQNPFIIGEQQVLNYTRVMSECAQAALARMQTN
ncbi:MBL fold metallo-hydrolase [Salinimonas lutimaris]|uniref:MBL fold metallo-hydrolase n=1 Tax=Salinimonas lutimaris TaxID=914153 RepID=UPI001585E37D|nr:MBL fold metallo-hydrolase [Salinimonas lutimaris]